MIYSNTLLKEGLTPKIRVDLKCGERVQKTCQRTQQGLSGIFSRQKKVQSFVLGGDDKTDR